MTGNTSLLIQNVYYTGAGIVLAGTGIRFLYHFFRDKDRKDRLVDEIENKHLPNIYAGLDQIATELRISITYPHPRL
jgi:hypothetical protein